MTNKFKALLLIIPLLLIAVILFAGYLRGTFTATHSQQVPLLRIGQTVVEVLLADKPEKWWQGLSGHPGLERNEGMLFIFPQKQTRYFWMKNMNFPLDIIWIDNDTVVHISENLPPEGETPEHRYSSLLPVNLVLEVNAGFVHEENIKIGDKVWLELGN